MRWLACLGVVLGLSCYDVPKPPCGFRCGPAGECPADYTCAVFEDRCHRVGTDPSLQCESSSDDTADAPVDTPIDAAPDAAPDAAIDAATDAPTD